MFKFGFINNVNHLKSILRNLNHHVFNFEKEKRFHIFENNKRVKVLLMAGFHIKFHHQIRNKQKFIDISYQIKEGNLDYFIGSFAFKRYSTKAHITQFILQELMGIMFDRIKAQRLVTYKGHNVLERIEMAENEYDKVYWQSILANLKKRYQGLRTGNMVDVKYLQTLSVQL